MNVCLVLAVVNFLIFVALLVEMQSRNRRAMKMYKATMHELEQFEYEIRHLNDE